jgi:carbon-monoxide dehydrogenase iron sulfur subunit
MKEITIDISKCTGCKSCEIACRVEHSLSKNLFTAISEDKLPQKRVFVETNGINKIPIQCRNCEDSPCITACMTGAMHKDSRGIAICDEYKCIGCFMCIMVCPFGVINISRYEKKVLKCDRCPDRDIPACVNACPTGAIKYEEVDEFVYNKRKGFVNSIELSSF